MEFRPKKFLLYLTGLWLFLILSLGGWWLYLIIKISGDLDNALNLQGLSSNQLDYLKLAKWEGATFVVLIMTASFALLYLYVRDIKKNQSLSAFFASLTHELKTPLASMRLQAEVIKETFDERHRTDTEEEKKFHKSMDRLTGRLLEDAQRLENELDNLLQLSRIERGTELKLKEISLEEVLMDQKRRYQDKFNLRVSGDLNQEFWGDEFSFNLILRNLIQNSMKHAKKNEASIIVQSDNEFIELNYTDSFEIGDIEPSKLTTLFYREGQSTGAGVGLYLARRLAILMSGDLIVTKNKSLNFQIKLSKV